MAAKKGLQKGCRETNSNITWLRKILCRYGCRKNGCNRIRKSFRETDKITWLRNNIYTEMAAEKWWQQNGLQRNQRTISWLRKKSMQRWLRKNGCDKNGCRKNTKKNSYRCNNPNPAVLDLLILLSLWRVPILHVQAPRHQHDPNGLILISQMMFWMEKGN